MDADRLLELQSEVEQDLAEARKRVTELELLRSYLAGKTESAAAGIAVNGAPKAVAAMKSVDFSGLTQHDAALIVLRRSDRPRSTLGIAKELIAGGYPNDDPKRLRTSLYTIMLKTPAIFVRTGPGMWDLVERA